MDVLDAYICYNVFQLMIHLLLLEYRKVESMWILNLYKMTYVTLFMYIQNEVLLNYGNSCLMSGQNQIHCESLLVGINIDISHDIMIKVENLELWWHIRESCYYPLPTLGLRHRVIVLRPFQTILSRIGLVPKPNREGCKAQSRNILPCGCVWGVIQIGCKIPIDTIHMSSVNGLSEKVGYRILESAYGRCVPSHYICITSHRILTHVQIKLCQLCGLFQPSCSGTVFQTFSSDANKGKDSQ